MVKLSENDPNENEEVFRNASLYPILICGIILILVGIILVVKRQIVGWNFPVTSIDRISSAKPLVSGQACIVLGVLMSIFPTIYLIKNSGRKRK